MKALVKEKSGRGFLDIKTMPDPVMGVDDVLIRIVAAGICGTDIHIMEDRFPSRPPVILGHEFSGEIVGIGKNVTQLKTGDRVVAEPHKGGCGLCRYCLTGNVEVCSDKRAIGYKIDGCFASHIALPSSSIHKIPDNVTYEHAALAEPLAVAIKAVLERSIVEPGDFVLVSGCGPIGLLAAAASKVAGAKAVMITGMDGDEALRLPAAREMGIDYTVNIQKEDLYARVMGLTNNQGADIVVEASGAEPAIIQAFDLIKIDGKISGIGLTGKDTIALPWDKAMKKAARITCSFSSNWTSWERALDILASGKINIDPVITEILPLSEWKTAFDKLIKLDAIKILLRP